MSGFVCPHCQDCTNIFSKGGGKALAEYCKIPFIGDIPIDPKLAMAAEKGENFLASFKESPASIAFQTIVNKLL